MPLVTDLDLPDFDLLDPGLKGERWHATAAALAAGGHWLAQAPLAVVVLGREAGEFFLRTKSAVFPGVQIADMFGITEGRLREQVDRNIINTNGPDHARLRSLVNPSLTPRAADTYRPQMRGFIERLWGTVAAAGRCEFVEAIAKPYPSLTIARVMGAPEEDAARLHDWSNWIQKQFDPIALGDADQRATIERKVGEFYDWVRPMIERRRATPSDDLISKLIVAEEGGDRLDDAELENLVLNLLVGGVDTTQSQLAQAIRLLAQRPDQWAALRDDPRGLAPAAADEALRYEPITAFTARQIVADVEHGGVTFPAGTFVMVCAFTGNRDPAVWSRADEFDITADRSAGRILTFGAGPHFCVGRNLARAELQEALAFLATRIERLELDGEPELQSVSGIYGVDALPITFRVST